MKTDKGLVIDGVTYRAVYLEPHISKPCTRCALSDDYCGVMCVLPLFECEYFERVEKRTKNTNKTIKHP